jgi:crotonobetainyl-CoA:carnitine CoA-transferase CaiB-like acyl-CoA transferase
MVGIPFKFGDTPAAVKRAPPTLGQHTEDVLKRDLGMDDQSIQSLREQKII